MHHVAAQPHQLRTVKNNTVSGEVQILPICCPRCRCAVGYLDMDTGDWNVSKYCSECGYPIAADDQMRDKAVHKK